MTSKFDMSLQSISKLLQQHNPEMSLDLSRRLLKLAVKVIPMCMLIVSCTRTTIPLRPTGTAGAEVLPVEPTALVFSTFEPSGRYAVVGIPEGDVLILRSLAGISGGVVDEIAYDARGITATGNVTNLGSSIWMEIQTSEGSRGWVNSLKLTEDVSQDQFCQDARALLILDQALHSIQQQDGNLLSQIVNPRRGLIIRHDWWNPELIIPINSVPEIYTDLAEMDWGLLSGGEFKIQGSFKDIILPMLEDTVLNAPVPECASLPIGMTSRPALWPTEYTTLNYFTIHRPSPEGGNDFDWRTWAFGIEYIDGQPFLTSLIHFHGDV